MRKRDANTKTGSPASGRKRRIAGLFRRKELPLLETRRSCKVKINMLQREDKARIFYRFRWPHHPNGGEDIALLGGWSTHPAAYLSQIKEFSASHRVLTLETRGYWRRSGLGKSTPSTYLDDCAEDLKAVMDNEQISRIVLVGHSMWGGIAMKFYERFPSRVSGLVLVSPGYRDPRKLGFISRQPVLHRPADVLFHAGGMLLPLGWVKRHILSRDPLSRSALEAAVLTIMEEAKNQKHASKMIKKVLRADIRAMSVSMKALFRMDDSLLENAGRISVPVLLIGGESDPLISPESVRILAGRIPDSEVAIIEGVKHFPMLSAPEQFNALLRGFLEEIG